MFWTIFKPSRRLRFGIIGGATIILIVNTAMVLTLIIYEVPLFTHPLINTSVSNLVLRKLSMALAAWTLASDLYILVLPISGVMSLQLSPKRKITISLVFGSGVG